jgi:hypothetical protein
LRCFSGNVWFGQQLDSHEALDPTPVADIHIVRRLQIAAIFFGNMDDRD